jgi:hypothetical protein
LGEATSSLIFIPGDFAPLLTPTFVGSWKDDSPIGGNANGLSSEFCSTSSLLDAAKYLAECSLDRHDTNASHAVSAADAKQNTSNEKYHIDRLIDLQ